MMNPIQLAAYRRLPSVSARAAYLVQIHEAEDFSAAITQINRRRSEINRQRREALRARLDALEAKRRQAVAIYFD